MGLSAGCDPTCYLRHFGVRELKHDWFGFFDSISHGKSEVGNYKVSGGGFKTYKYLERYAVSGLRALKRKIEIGAVNPSSD
jgi:hypothetical protein